MASWGHGRRWALPFFVGLLMVGPLLAQPKAIVSLQPERIETGDTTTLLLFVSGLNTEPKDVDFSAWTSVLPSKNILRRSEWKRSGTQWTRRFTLIAFDSAMMELPPIQVRIASGKPLETNALQLSVFPTRGGRNISDMAKIRDIRREPESWLDYWSWAAGSLLVLALVFWWMRQNRRKPQPVAMPLPISAPPVSPSEQALQKLTQLQQKQYWKNGQTKEHYAELSLIVREYLETRYGIAALESTTIEIQNMLKKTDFSPESQRDLQDLLLKTDLVKYAQSSPSEATHDAVLVKARELVSPLNVKKTELPKKPPAPPKPPSNKYEPL